MTGIRQRIHVVVCSLLAGTLATAAPAWGAPASPEAISVDCDLVAGVTATTITGRLGDTVVLDNTAGSGDGCTFASYAGVVDVTNLSSNILAAGATSTLTITGAGTFTITPRAFGGGGTPTTFTVIIGDPRPVPEYTISFDANGGDCSRNPLTINAAAGDWYALPTDGTGAGQCHREGYRLIGWSHGTTLQSPGAPQQVPDLLLASVPADVAWTGLPGLTHASAADHVTLYAVWSPIGVEIVYDANVAAADSCVTSAGDNLPESERSTAPTVLYSGRDQLASGPPCAPPGYRFVGWGLTAQGAASYSAGEDVGELLTGSSVVHLYAHWTPDSELRASAPCRDLMQQHVVTPRPTTVLATIVALGPLESFGLETQVICPQELGPVQTIVFISGVGGTFTRLGPLTVENPTQSITSIPWGNYDNGNAVLSGNLSVHSNAVFPPNAQPGDPPIFVATAIQLTKVGNIGPLHLTAPYSGTWTQYTNGDFEYDGS